LFDIKWFDGWVSQNIWGTTQEEGEPDIKEVDAEEAEGPSKAVTMVSVNESLPNAITSHRPSPCTCQRQMIK